LSDWEWIGGAPKGDFYGWANQTGQVVIGNVVEVGVGRSTNGDPVPELTVQLTEKTRSFSKGEWTEYGPGETIVLTCQQSNLRKKVDQANLNAGDMVRIELESLFPTEKGKAKIFDVKVRRGGAVPVAAPKPAVSDDFSDEPPF